MDFIQLTVCFFLFAAIQVQAISKEREREILRQLLTDCKDKEGGSDSDFERMVHEQLPEAQEGRCMLSCVYEVIGIVSYLFGFRQSECIVTAFFISISKENSVEKIF